MAQLVNVRVKYLRPYYDNLKEWMQDPNNVYIGRGRVVFIDGQRYPPYDSTFANPFKVPRDGNLEEVIAKYEQYLIHKIETGVISREAVDNLKGKNLGCWCKNTKQKNIQCHGDVLLKILDVWDEYLANDITS